ncbi:DUF4159 domain-containing protein [Alphaproteobacteria bacterium]|nr:DUF4159 domain-containing protein [Alphaproteobacteria bacterium]
MLDFGALVFTTPWMLASLAFLPMLWWLLRVMPPTPMVRAFPPLRFILALKPREETPVRTPLWLILLRILIAALIIVGLSNPLLNPGERLHGNGPLMIVIDNGWASAPRWNKRITAINALADQAERDGRAIRYITTAQPHPDDSLRISELLRPSDARDRLRSIQPQPWPTDHDAVHTAIAAAPDIGSAHVAWLSDGLNGSGTAALMGQLQQLGSLSLYLDSVNELAKLVGVPSATADDISVPVLRANDRGEEQRWMRLIDEEGRLLGREQANFKDGEKQANTFFRLPVDVRNRSARVEIEGENGAGAVFLMDDRWRRRPVGIAAGNLTEGGQPLLSDDYYLVRALGPFNQIKSGTVKSLLEHRLAMIVLTDIGKLSNAEVDGLSGWINKGGVLLRFAGPQLAQGSDALVPVKLRGSRALGGSMSWTNPAKLMPFDDKGPFAGLKIPTDIRIHRQVLAEPTINLNDKTWIRLSDGTPLVTAERRGTGWVVLIHTTANAEWSNLPISGLFIELLQRIVALSKGITGDDGKTTYPPLATMDGFGVLGTPPPAAVAIAGRDFASTRVGSETPPGHYGQGEARRSLNVSTGIEQITLIAVIPSGVMVKSYDVERGVDVKPWLLLAALLLALLDLVITNALRGLKPHRTAKGHSRAATVIASAIVVSTVIGTAAMAQTRKPQDPEEAFALRATLETRLAYVVTGDTRLDKVSRFGLVGLSALLRQRTAIEPGSPVAVDIERDELAYFPLLYWPISARQRPPSDHAVENLNAYLRSGGNILFDTREQASLRFDPFGTGGARSAKLRQLLSGLEIPALTPVPTNHVLTKSFYLLKQFPGRWTGGTLWVERRRSRHNDGVSSIIIGSNDWAGAWAVDSNGVSILPVVPGGERQREYAYRFGVNWVMYCLTGNYKSDQVHVPAIIERLGQ